MAWLWGKIDGAQVWKASQNLDAVALGGVLLILWATLVAIAKRWQLVIRLGSPDSRANVPLPNLIEATVIGAFFNQFLPSSVGGDFFRVLAVRRYGVSLNEAVTGVFLDRLCGFLSLGILCILAIPAEGQILMASGLKWPFLLTLLLLAGVFGGGLLLLLIPTSWYEYPLLRPFRPLIEMTCRFFRHKLSFGAILLSSLLSSILVISGIQVLIMAFDIPLTWAQGAAILPAVMMLSSLPISFAGWGLREGAMIIALGAYGVPAEKALALSLIYGILHLISAIPGLVLWIGEKRRIKVVTPS